VLRDSHIFGEAEAEDCPDNHDCFCLDKMAFMLFGGNHKDKSLYITSPSPRPLHKVKSYGNWAANSDITNTIFEHFTSNKTACGAQQRIFGLNNHASDYVPLHTFDFTTFKNVHTDAMTYLYDPPEEWHNPTDCIGFPCTAPSNVVLVFDNTVFEGSIKPSFTDRKF